MAIIEKYTKILELDKILSSLNEYACCDYASELILSTKPSTNINIVRDEVGKTNDAFYLASHFGTPTFMKISNPKDHLKLAQVGGILTPRALLNIASVLREVRILLDWYSQCKGKQNSLRPIFDNLTLNKELEKRISATFINEEEIDDYASEELANIRRKIKQYGAKIKENLEKMIRSATYQKALQEHIITMRDGRYVVPVKAEYKGVVSGLVHDTSASGATLFIEPMSVVEANNDIKVLQSKEKVEIERILAELSALCGDNENSISYNFDTIISLNIYFAKSNLAEKMNAMMPEITNNGKIRLNKARHPLIPKNQVVPITVDLGYDYTSLVITGPNTGGKTVTLKTIGLLTLMTMCGMLIPVSDDSVISIFENILVDMGDEQSIAQNLSTFSAHMTNIVSILNIANEQSLVLVDELGSGTDPVEGAAIAVSILEKFRGMNTIVAATTHYAELKVYALQTDGVKNASCEFDVKTLKPTYRLLIGTPGRSNAFEISRKLGLSDEILNVASNLVTNDKKNFEDVIDSLEASRQDFEEKTASLKHETNQLKQLQEDLRHSNLDAINEKERIIDKARVEAKRIVDNVKLDSDLIMEELDKLRKQKEKADFAIKASQAKSLLRGKIDKLHDMANPVVERTNEDYVLPRKLKKGDEVLIVDIDKTGYVLQEVDNSGNVLVQAGMMKSRVSIKNLRLVENKKSTKPKGGTTRRVTSNKVVSASMELDLRGEMVEEALAELDMFVNQCLMSNANMVTIIHGKGTGALRSAVHVYLRQSKYIKTFRLGLYGEGESGVTIVEFK